MALRAEWSGARSAAPEELWGHESPIPLELIGRLLLAGGLVLWALNDADLGPLDFIQLIGE